MKTRILMVCLGNICRSPLAEGILKSKIDAAKVLVESAGTGGWHIGQPPDDRSIEVARKYGIDITDQRGRKFSTYDFEAYDHIFVMDYENYKDVIQLAASEAEIQKVKLLLDELFPGENVDVPDPYFGGKEGFENVFHLIEEACEKIASRLT